ncbi:MAG TPA: HEAT repeat domain-containing protein [Geothrix sp.]|nr:HEAT repeat domain-containing protein [Geothrix sp.]
MSDFPQLAQSLAVALKALQMYTAAHPRTQEALVAGHAVLDRWLLEAERLQFVVSGPKAFVDGQVQDARNPHVALLVKLIAERGVSGFVFERGVLAEELLAFLQGFATKPARLEEMGGFEALLTASGVRHIRVSQTRYQEVLEGEESGPDDKAPAFAPAPPPPPASPSPDNLVKFIRDALQAALARGAASSGSHAAYSSGSHPAFGSGPAPVPSGADDGLGFLRGFHPADLSHLGPLGQELGLGEGMPTPSQLGTLRQVLMGLTPEVQLNLLAGLSTLPEKPAGLALGVKALAGEILAVATSTALAQGASWVQLRGPIQDILRPLAERQVMGRALSAHLRSSGQDAAQAEAILRHLEWEALSLEAKLLKVLEEGYLFELSVEHRLAFLRELLDLRRHDDFLHIMEALLDILRSERNDLRLKAAQTLTGVARWAHDPGLPPGGEGPLAEGLRAHFAWEPEPPIHRWTAESLEAALAALVLRGDFAAAMSDFGELEGLCAFLEEQHPWRNDALARLRAALLRPALMDAVVQRAFSLERDQMILQVHPYLEFLGDPMTRHLVARLGEETDRTRRGRLVEAVRSMGPSALPALMDALSSPAWYLVRNALTLLADLGDAGCVPATIPLLRHPEPRVRRTAVRALWKLGGPVAEPHLLARMKDTDAETLQEILFALGQLRSEGSLGAVSELIQDKRVIEKLRIQALDTLGHIASPKAIPVLLECLRRKGFFGGGESQPIRLAAARALVAMDHPEATAALRKAVDAEPKGEEREAMRRLLEPPVQP